MGIAFIIILIHWVADFVLQTDKQAKGKSKNWTDLLSHTMTYSVVWLAVGLIWVILSNFNLTGLYVCDIWFVVKFTIITFLAHTTTDYFTSRVNSKLWSENKVHLFFVSIGFDQILHYAQLFLTFYLL